jgi:hypothetical protein
MPNIKWTDGNPPIARIIGPYQWNERNEFTCEVAAEDVPGIITLPGFDLADGDDLTQLRGIGQSWADELALAGIVSLRQLAEADVADLADRIGARWSMVQAWQGQAQALEEQREPIVDDTQDGAQDEAPHG